MPLVTYQGRDLEYEIHGDGDATPLLLATGTGGSFKGWLPLQVPEFSKRGRVIVFNHRGVGLSADNGKPFSTADLADDMVGLLDALKIARIDVLGAFMGGMAAQEMALRNPARVRRLVLTGTYARADAKRRMLLDHWASLAARGLAVDAMVRERMLWSLQDETLEQEDLIEGMVEYLSKGGTPVSADVFARQCTACMEHDTYDRLRHIVQETLVVSGRYDLLTPPRFHRELADEIPNARLVTVRYAAHLVMVESAERFNSAVSDFLDEA